LGKNVEVAGLVIFIAAPIAALGFVAYEVTVKYGYM
jgi:hypothetical protein